jgi:bifunctional non-homologous end joining protein LigD
MALRASPYGFIEPCSLQPREPVQGALVPHQREVVACDDNGLAVFELLRRKSEGRHVIVFDLLKLDGDDLRREPFETRKATLASLLRKPAGPAPERAGASGRRCVPARLQARAGGLRVEAVGIALSLRPTNDWLKLKNPDAPAVKREAEEDWGR